MKNQLFIRFEQSFEQDQVSWLKSGGDDGLVAKVKQGSLQDAAVDAALVAQVIVIVPGEDVLLTTATVPGKKSRSVARQAIPFLLEDQLIADVESLHFALGQTQDSTVSVAVVADDVMVAWLLALREVGIDPHALVPDTLMLPLESEAWTLLTGIDNKLLLRTGEQAGMAFDVANGPETLAAALEDVGEQQPTSLAVYECGEQRLNLPDFGIEMTRAPVSESALSLLVAGYQTSDSINLLQGGYSRRERIGQFWRPWRVPIGLVAALIVLQVAVSILEYQRLSSERTRLWDDIVATYQQAFPNEKNVPYPQRQMEGHLKRLRGGGGSSGASFSGLLVEAGRQFKATKTLTLQRLSYKNGGLDVALTIADLQKLDQLKQDLIKGGIAVEIVSAASRKKHVEARLRISEKSS